MILYLIFYEVYFMNTFSFMQRKHKKEIVFMKVVNQVVSIQHLPALSVWAIFLTGMVFINEVCSGEPDPAIYLLIFQRQTIIETTQPEWLHL